MGWGQWWTTQGQAAFAAPFGSGSARNGQLPLLSVTWATVSSLGPEAQVSWLDRETRPCPHTQDQEAWVLSPDPLIPHHQWYTCLSSCQQPRPL